MRYITINNYIYSIIEQVYYELHTHTQKKLVEQKYAINILILVICHSIFYNKSSHILYTLLYQLYKLGLYLVYPCYLKVFLETSKCCI